MILREIHNFLESNYTVFITDPANGEWIISDAQLPDVEIKLSNGTIQFKSIIYVFDTHLIGMFVLNKIAEKLAAVGCGLNKFVPRQDRESTISISRVLAQKYLATGQDIAKEIQLIQAAHKLINDYLTSVIEANEMSFVDISMFEGLDVDSFDVTDVIERKYFEFESWGKLIESANANIASEESAAKIEKMLRAYQQFEEKNPNICLGEVLKSLPAVISEAYASKNKSVLN